MALYRISHHLFTELNHLQSKFLHKNLWCRADPILEPFSCHDCMHCTVAINEFLCMKNAGSQIAMDFS
jgi:hypothetical protein